MGNIVEGSLDLQNVKYLPADHDEFPDLLLKPGDLLFNRANSAESAFAFRIKPLVARAWLADPVMQYARVEAVILEHERGSIVEYAIRNHNASVGIDVTAHWSNTESPAILGNFPQNGAFWGRITH